MDLKWRLQSLKKGSRTMGQYIIVAKDLIDHILAVSDKISDYEQILYILGGLDSNYTSLVITITSKKWVLFLDEVFTCTRIMNNKEKHEYALFFIWLMQIMLVIQNLHIPLDLHVIQLINHNLKSTNSSSWTPRARQYQNLTCNAKFVRK